MTATTTDPLRRRVLAAPAALLAPPAMAGIADAQPPWATRLGDADAAYGLPGAAEQGVRRVAAHTHPLSAGFAIWHSPIQHQRGIITPSGLHFAVHHNGVPAIDPQRHTLLVHGRVRRALRFDLEQLLRFPMVSRIHFIECAGNTAPNAVAPLAEDLDAQMLYGQLSCSEWTGIPLRTLLQEAGLEDDAAWVIAEGADGGSHARSLPLKPLADRALVALYQNGERLRPSQGYPLRLLVPGEEGNVNVKWLHRLELSTSPAHTKDESGLYTRILADGRIERFASTMDVKSVITTPSGRQTLPAQHGHFQLRGLAWSGRGRIQRVDVSVDGGRSWVPAQLDGPVLDRALTSFSLPWRWEGKAAVLMSRASDEHGHTQPTRADWRRRHAAHSFNHYNAIQAWRIDRNGSVANVYD